MFSEIIQMKSSHLLSVDEAADILSNRMFNCEFKSLTNAKERRKLLLDLHEIYCSDGIDVYLEIDGQICPVIQYRLYKSKLAKNLNGTLGINFYSEDQILHQVYFKKSSFQNFVEDYLATTFPENKNGDELVVKSLKELGDDFKQFLIQQMQTGKRQHKKIFQKIAREKYRLKIESFKEIWRDACAETKSGWDKKGRVPEFEKQKIF